MNNLLYRIKKQLPILIIGFLACSCEDIVEEDPISSVRSENFYKNGNDARIGVAGIYDAMQKTYRTKYFAWGEFRSDNYKGGSNTGDLDKVELVNNQLSAGNDEATRWNNFYRMIYAANLAIEKIPLIEDPDPQIPNLLGEAYAIRAYAYFDAIRVWGKAPLILEPIENPNEQVEFVQSTTEEIYSKSVIPDMLRAEELINQNPDPYRFTLNSLWAFQANVYMWRKEYDKVKEVLDKLVATGDYSLVRSANEWQDLFLNSQTEASPSPVKIQQGPELIMSINFDESDSDRSGIFATFFAGRPSYFLSTELQEKWIAKFPIDSAGWVDRYPNTDPVLEVLGEDDDETRFIYGDWRLYFSREDGVEGDFDDLSDSRMAKYNKFNYNPSIDDSDIILFRYSGILLLLAEAENQLGDSARALNLVNQIRTARKLPLVTAEEFGATIDDRENFILDERQFELLGEGKRWWDLRRTGKAVETLNLLLEVRGEQARLLNDDLLFFPVFTEHLNDNPKLMQLPGY